MQNAFIIHGICDREEYFSQAYPSPSNFHWLPWLQKQLIMDGYNCQTPEMPTPYAPSYEQWREIFEYFPIEPGAILIGHSAGCGFLLRWLSETGTQCAKLVLVAPWLDPYKECGTFLNFTPGLGLSKQCGEIHVLYSDDDPVTAVGETTQQLKISYPHLNYHHYTDCGHFCIGDLETSKFHDLYDIIIC